MASGTTKRKICVSADSSTVAVAEETNYQVFVTAYCVADGLETFRLTTSCGYLNSVALGADGKLLLLCYDSEIELWAGDNCIETFCDPHGSLPKLLEFEAATISVDATYVIGVGFRERNQWEKSIVVWSVDGSTSPVVVDARWEAWTSSIIHSVHIDQTLDIYLVRSHDDDLEWHDAAFVLQHRVWSGAPKEVQLARVPRIPDERFTLHRDGWVTRFNDGSGTLGRLCWIPPSRRTGESVRFHGYILPLLSDSGEVSFFDLSAFEENGM